MLRPSRSRPRTIAVSLTAALIVAGLAAAPGASAAGSLDSAFGTGGRVLTAFGSDDYARDVAVQPDGKLLVAGASWDGTKYRFALARYGADGALDPTFGTGGKVLTAVGTSSSGHALAIQADGKIVVAGHAYVFGQRQFAVARYTAGGSLDNTFSGDGMTTTALGTDDVAWDALVQPDGRIVVTGQAKVSSVDRIAMVRYTSAGALDTSFASSGTVTTLLGSAAAALGVVRQADGKLVAAGTATQGGVDKLALVRYTSGGSIDTSFGASGSTLTAVGTTALATTVALDASGRLVVAGGAIESSISKFVLARYGANGALDASFGSGGTALVQIGAASAAYSVGFEPDGAIVAAGDTVTSTVHRFAMTRLDANGAPDTSFGSGGSVTTAIGSNSAAYNATVQPDGNVVAVGFGNPGSGSRQFALARYVGVDPPPSDPPPSDPPPSDPPPSDPPPSDGGGTTGGGTTGGDAPGGGLAGQIVPGDSVGILPPDVKPITLPKQPLSVEGTGTVAVRLKCVQLATGVCKGTVVILMPSLLLSPPKHRISSARRRKMTRVAHRSVRLKSGASAAPRLKLSAAAQAALRRRGTIPVEVQASMEVGGEVRTSTRRYTLRAPKRSR